jgi:hypothetical protein
MYHYVKMMAHGQIFLGALSMTLAKKNKYLVCVQELQVTALKAFCITDVISVVIRES